MSLAGEKLVPFVIYKGKKTRGSTVYCEFTNPSFDYPDLLEYNVQKEAWMDMELMLCWIEQVWRPWTIGRGRTYLLLDSFKAHKTTQVLNALTACNTVVNFIPPGYTSKLQTLDVGVNKPFKGYLKEEYEKFMFEFTKKGEDNVQPKCWNVAQWIDIGWDKISTETITNTWRRIGIGENGDENLDVEIYNDILNLLANNNASDDVNDDEE